MVSSMQQWTNKLDFFFFGWQGYKLECVNIRLRSSGN
jgi:hypothetical protein